MNETPRSNRTHIAIFGRTNAGKSSIINALTNQDIALVSDIKGTTTDPVFKSMEILPLGPVVLIDTAGLDDISELGPLRIQKSMDVLSKTDIVILVVDAKSGMTTVESTLITQLQSRNIPFLILFNKSDLIEFVPFPCEFPHLWVSASDKTNIPLVLDTLGKMKPKHEEVRTLVGDLVNPGDIVILVTPIDKAAPKGRLILPQQQVIRDLLDSDCITLIVKEHELKMAIESLNRKPKMVITDSQVFLKASADTPSDVFLTSFSILFARYKGELEPYLTGIKAIDKLKDGDRILIAEGCTHHKSCDDIGTVKLPRWIRQYTGKQLTFEALSGHAFPTDLSSYALVLMCGSCMLNRTEVESRLELVRNQTVPIVNYGMAIAHVQGILRRSLQIFPSILQQLEE